MPHSEKPRRIKVVLGTALFGDPVDPQAKINTPEAAKTLPDIYRRRGYTEIDTARGYPVGAAGSSERLLGNLNEGNWMTLGTKVVSWEAGTHKKERIAASVDGSLEALKTQRLYIYYLHAPDPTTPFEEVCGAMHDAYTAGKFERFGISNYSAKQVEELVRVCEENGWIKRSVYQVGPTNAVSDLETQTQGQYNAISRGNEDELFPALRKHGISFYTYSPSAAGFFSGKVTRDAMTSKDSRWDTMTLLGQMYVQEYFKDALFDAAAAV